MPKKPIILINAHVYPRHPGDGVAPFMHDFAKACLPFARVVAHCPHAEGLAESEIIDGVEVRRFRYAAEKNETLAYQGDMHKQVARSPIKAALFLQFLYQWKKSTTRLIDELQPDLVHAHWLIPGGYITAKAIGKRQTPLFLSMHGTDVFLMRKNKIARYLSGNTFRKAKKSHFVSKALQNIVSESCHRPPAQEDLIFPMAFGLDYFEQSIPLTPQKRFLFIGRLLEYKGCDVLLRAFAKVLKNRDFGWNVHLLGEGPQKENLTQLVQSLNLAKRVVFHGTVSRQDVLQHYANANVLILPSREMAQGDNEGLGVVLLEAMSVGIPVIGTTSGGIPEIVNNEVTGLLVEQNNVDALAEAMIRIQEDELIRKQIIEGAREMIRTRFSDRGLTEVIQKWYEL